MTAAIGLMAFFATAGIDDQKRFTRIQETCKETIRQLEGEMRRTIIAALWLGSVAVAAAQTLETTSPPQWTHPEGLYSISTSDFVNRGSDGPYYIATFAPSNAPPGPSQLQCSVQHRPFWTDGTQPANIMNNLLRRRLPQSATITESTVGGVTVFNFQEDHGSFAIHYRVFQLPSARGNDYHELTCGGSKPISVQQWQLLDSLLNSLEFQQN